MSEEFVNLEIDGKPVQARKGAMLIEVTDRHGAYVPRFCYHEKLSIAANCRMCLVDVEKAPKPLPACATPVAEGLKVFTRSPRAIAAQKATMEFLLINHPLDCPICDQGGECELQDLAMGYGRDVSRYVETKRVIKDNNIGPLISTDMTRCILCTRCVRFGQEIEGIQELGTMGRGEFTQISTYVQGGVDHELSGNIIDLCPVGALNNKPYRYRARAWEMTQHPLVSPHDCVGTNLYGHVLRGRLMRVVPRDNEQINETWIADRDRFSCEGLYADDRAMRPMVREDGKWRETDWETALAAAATGLQDAVREAGPGGIGCLVSPNATLEELYLSSRLMRGLGSENVDHRLRRVDFSGQQADALAPELGCSLVELQGASAILLVGSNPRQEAPLIAHRIRMAATRHEAGVALINPLRTEVTFPLLAELTRADGTMAATPRLRAARGSASEQRSGPGPSAGSARTAHSHRRARKRGEEAGDRRGSGHCARRACSATPGLRGIACARGRACQSHGRAPWLPAGRR